MTFRYSASSFQRVCKTARQPPNLALLVTMPIAASRLAHLLLDQAKPTSLLLRGAVIWMIVQCDSLLLRCALSSFGGIFMAFWSLMELMMEVSYGKMRTFISCQICDINGTTWLLRSLRDIYRFIESFWGCYKIAVKQNLNWIKLKITNGRSEST